MYGAEVRNAKNQVICASVAGFPGCVCIIPRASALPLPTVLLLDPYFN